MRSILSYFLLFLSVALSAQSPAADFPSLSTKELPDGKFKPGRIFTGTALFGYMNGGAELFLEYGVAEARITELELEKSRFKTEIYRMRSPEDALGIFSVSRFKCRSMPDVAAFTCQNKYQLQLCSGSYYINIINYAGSEADSVISLKIAKVIVSQIDEPSANLAEYFPVPSAKIAKQDLILAKGRLGIINGASEWEDYLVDYDWHVVAIFSENDRTHISMIFRNQADLKKFCEGHNFNAEIGLEGLRQPGGEIVSSPRENHLLIEIVKQES